MHRPSLTASILCLAGLILSSAAEAQGNRPGIAGRQAPAWDLQWLNLPEERSSLDVSDFQGKVLYVFCFQSWCPGCHSHGFPALQKVEQHFQDNDNVHFVAIHTVFEGFGTNTTHRALDDLADYGLDIPLAHDTGNADAGGHSLSPFMRDYRTGGTPWTILIAPDGRVVWNGFKIEAEDAIAAIERMLDQQASSRNASASETPAESGTR